MKLSRNVLENAISNNKIKAVFFFGAEVFIDFYTNKFKQKLLQSYENLSVLNYFFDDFNLNEISQTLNSSSLFGDIKFVNIKIDKKLSKKDAQTLVEACFKAENYMVLSYYNNQDFQYSKNALVISSAFEKSTLDPMNSSKMLGHIRFFDPYPNESLHILVQKATELGLEITQDAIFEILEIQNGNLQMALNELNKYVIFKEKITLDLVKFTSSNLSTLNKAQIIEALFTSQNIAEICLKLIDEGESSNELLARVENYFYNLFLIFAHAKMHGKIEKIANILGFNPPPDIARSYLLRALKIKEKDFQKIFFILCEAKIQARALNQDHSLREFLAAMLKIKRLLEKINFI